MPEEGHDQILQRPVEMQQLAGVALAALVFVEEGLREAETLVICFAVVYLITRVISELLEVVLMPAVALAAAVVPDFEEIRTGITTGRVNPVLKRLEIFLH